MQSGVFFLLAGTWSYMNTKVDAENYTTGPHVSLVPVSLVSQPRLGCSPGRYSDAGVFLRAMRKKQPQWLYS